MIAKFKQGLKEYARVLKLTKKPNMVEFKTIVKISALGMGVIGLVGFLITMANQLLIK